MNLTEQVRRNGRAVTAVRDNKLTTLKAFNDLADYAFSLIGSQPMPSYLKHGLSQMIVPGIGEVGGLIKWANKMSELNFMNPASPPFKPFEIVKTAREAEKAYQQKLKFGLEFLGGQSQVENHQAIHLNKLIGEFERLLAGWTKWQSQSR